VLFVNVPIGAFVVWQAPRRLVESSVGEESERSLDLPGAVTVTGGLALLVYAMVDATSAGWTSTATILRIAGALVLLAAFVVIESRTRRPLVPFAVFRRRTLRGANIVGVLIGMSLFSMFFLITLYLQQVLGDSALEAGISYLPLAVSIIVAAGGAGALVTRVGFKPVLVAGMLLVAAALAWFTQVSAGGSYLADVLGPSILAGLGLGLAFVPVTIAAMSGSSPDEAGLASGLINTSQQVGGALGLAILASIANSSTSSAFESGVHDKAVALTTGFSDAFTVGACFAVAGALLAALLISSRDSREHAEAAQRGELEAVPA
jgi:predicted MFS family arabinose efflux permease